VQQTRSQIDKGYTARYEICCNHNGTRHKTVGEGAKTIGETVTAINQIVKAAAEVATMVQEIAAAAEEQSASVEEVTASIEDLSAISEESAAGTQETSAAAENSPLLWTSCECSPGSCQIVNELQTEVANSILVKQYLQQVLRIEPKHEYRQSLNQNTRSKRSLNINLQLLLKNKGKQKGGKSISVKKDESFDAPPSQGV